MTLFKETFPLIQAPMAGAQNSDLAIAVLKSGGVGSLPCALFSAEQIRQEIKRIRGHVSGPLNLNFFSHKNPDFDEAREKKWRRLLRPYYLEFGLNPDMEVPRSNRNPFNEESCSLVEEIRPHYVSFHFGLPSEQFIERIKRCGSIVLSSATTVEEARWLEEHGVDAVIIQGLEAGGHRGMFLTQDLATQKPMIELLRETISAVKIPVIASGGIATSQDVKIVMNEGAAGVQVGTAYLLSPESKVSSIHRNLLKNKNSKTAVTNIFTGRPARGLLNRIMRELGPISPDAPAFPLAGGALVPLKNICEKVGSGDFSSLWAGEAYSLCREISAEEITKELLKGFQ